jgi:hypothetical protein
MTDIMTSQYIALSSWDTLYAPSKGRLITILKSFPTHGKVFLITFLFGSLFNFMYPLHKTNAQWNHTNTSASVLLTKFDMSIDIPQLTAGSRPPKLLRKSHVSSVENYNKYAHSSDIFLMVLYR